MTTNDKLARAEAMDLMREVERLRKALADCDREVSHAIMGDWSIALQNIRRNIRAALNTDRSA